MIYNGYTYPKIFANKLVWRLWKRCLCKRGWHLWDEVYSSEDNHYLYCDACDISFPDGNGDELNPS